jgi:hypothetical protein
VPSPTRSFEVPSRAWWGGAVASPGANDRVRALSLVHSPSPLRSPRRVSVATPVEADSDSDGGVRLCGVITGPHFNWRSALTVVWLWGHLQLVR